MFLAALPDAGTAQRIHQLAHVLKHAHKFEGNVIEAERLHVSLFFLGGLPEPAAWLARDAAAEMRTPPFEVLFDRAVSFQGKSGNRPLVLVGDEGLERLKSFRRTLVIVMARKGLRYLAKRDFTPHVTLLYGERMVEEHPIEPIGWSVNEFVLIHSLRGHVQVARWPLRP